MAINQNIVVLVGGVGGAKLALGLSRIIAPGHLTMIVNTGDDFIHYGLKICPDLDTVMYTLSRLVDPVYGWGIANDTTATLQALSRYGEDPWFRLGDQDIATHLLRTHLLREGYSLTEVIQHLSRALSIPHNILPMTDAAVPTIVDTVEYGELEFQSYFVKYRWRPTVKKLHYVGSKSASVSKSVCDAIQKADIILTGPSNPWLSIAPILSVSGMRDLILSRNVPRVAVTPIVDGTAIKGPAAKLMKELGYEVSAKEVMKYYDEVINGFIYDKRDETILEDGARSIALNTIMNTEEDKIELARKILNWIQGW